MHHHYNSFKKAFASAGITALAALILFTVFMLGYADVVASADSTTAKAWIMCQPGDYVNVRERASRKSDSFGRLDTGSALRVTGETKDGFAKCEVALEQSQGWIYAGYIVFEEPVSMNGRKMVIRSNGRVACRKCIEGQRRCWAYDGDEVSVWYMADGWAVTNKGFIRTEFLQEGRSDE